MQLVSDLQQERVDTEAQRVSADRDEKLNQYRRYAAMLSSQLSLSLTTATTSRTHFSCLNLVVCVQNDTCIKI